MGDRLVMVHEGRIVYEAEAETTTKLTVQELLEEFADVKERRFPTKAGGPPPAPVLYGFVRALSMWSGGTAMETSVRARRAPWSPAVLTIAVTGLLLGGVNSLSNVLGSPYSPHALRPYPGEGVFSLQVLAAVVGTAWAWALVAFALGWRAPTARWAASTAIAALAVASVVYYVSDHALGLNDRLETGETVYWVVISVGAGSVFGLLGHLARRPRWWSLLPGLAAPGVIVLLSGPAGSDHIQPWPERLAWGMAAVLTIVLTLRWAREQR